MKRLQHIVRVRISDEQKKLLAGKKLSKYVREALVEKMEREFADKFHCPF